MASLDSGLSCTVIVRADMKVHDLWAAAGSVDTALSFLNCLELYRTDVLAPVGVPATR